MPGTVTDIRVAPDKGFIVGIRWSNGYENHYRYGANGKFEVDFLASRSGQVLPTTTVTSVVKTTVAPCKMLVQISDFFPVNTFLYKEY